MSLSNITEQFSKIRMKSDSVIICPYILYTSCLEGDSCEYAPDISPEYVPPKDVECESFRNGKCKHGKSCWFRHQCERNNKDSNSHHHEDSESTNVTRPSLNVKNPAPERNKKDSKLHHHEDSESTNVTRPSLNVKNPATERNKKDSKLHHHEDSESTNVTRPSLNVKNPAPTSVQTAPKIKNRISFWHENNKRWQNHITKYPISLKSNIEKAGYERIASRMENCSHFTTGICPNEKCIYFHGFLCNFCHKYCVHPFDEDEQLKHVKECTRRCTRGSDCSVCHKIESEKKLHLDRRYFKANRQKR